MSFTSSLQSQLLELNLWTLMLANLTVAQTRREGRQAEGAREERPGAHEGRVEILSPNHRTVRENTRILGESPNAKTVLSN